MAINFSPLYTGKGSAVVLPELDKASQAQKRAGELAIRAEEMRLDKAIKDREKLIKNMQVEPVQVASEILMLKQAKETEAYNNKWGARGVEKAGNMSVADDMEMAIDRNRMRQNQATMLAQDETFKAALNESDPKKDVRGYWDRKFVENEYRKWLTDPNYKMPSNLLKARPQNFANILMQDKTVGASAFEREEPILDSAGKPTNRVATVSYARSKEEAAEDIFNKLSDPYNDGIREGVIQDFLNADGEEQRAFLEKYDTNPDGIIDPQEAQYAFSGNALRENPVVRWAMSHEPYLASSMKRVIKKTQGVTTTTKSSTGTNPFVTVDIGMGAPIKYQPTDRQTATLGSTTYNTYHTFPEWPIQNIPTASIEVQRPSGNRERATSKTMSIRLTGYDEERDEFTALAESNYIGSIGKGDQIAIKRSDMPPAYNNVKILVDGKPVTVGSIKTGGASQQATTSAKKTFDPTTGTFK